MKNTKKTVEPSTYLSRSEGKFRVIFQALPVSRDFDTAAEALHAAKLNNVVPDAALMWDGDRAAFVPR